MNEEGQIGEDQPGKETGQQQWSQQPPQQPPQQQQQYPQRQPSDYKPPRDIKRTLGLMLAVGVILLLIGALFISASGLIDPNPDDPDDREDAADTIRYLRTIGSLIITIGIFIPAIGSSYLLYGSQDLSDQEKLILSIVASATVIGFALVINTAPFGMFF